MISKEIENQVIASYNTGQKSFNEVAKLCKINNVSVKTILKRNNVKLHDKSKFYRKTSLNEDYFKEINSEDKAYFLGLILADGNVHKRRLSISLQEEDKSILDSMIERMNYTGKLRRIKPRNANHKVQYTLEIQSQKIITDLKLLGIVERKSLVVDFPNIPKELYSHFIRGVFDGDGSVHISTRKNGRSEARVQFIGSVPFITKLFNFFREENIKGSNIKLTNLNKNANIYFSSKKSLLELREFLYRNSTIFLKRKYKKFDEVLKFFSSKKFIYKNETIYQYDKNRNFIQTWDSIEEIMKNNNFNRDAILKCIRGKLKTSGKYIWLITKI